MRVAGNKNKIKVVEQNISYYNEVADRYDTIMDQDHSNKIVRQKVKDKFLSLVKSGTVLEFGGGTGLDLEWLTSAGYKIFFCEPSPAMREKAIEYNNSTLHYPDIFFLDTAKTDFTKWHADPPFPQQVDAILSNFGVINYIPDIGSLFNSLALVLKRGGQFIAIILDLNFKKRLKWHRRNAIRSLILRIPFKMYIPFKDKKQSVFVYTPREIEKASGRYFDHCECEFLTGLDFTLIHLNRNEKPYQEMVNG
jgi:SAM-dependent methyltransferase